MKKILSLTLAGFLFTTLFAQQGKPIILETKNIALVLSVNNNQRLTQSYLGKKLSNSNDYSKQNGGREVYLTAGMENQFEPAIRMVHADGNPSLELKYISHKTDKKEDATTTDIILKDPVYATEVVLHYVSYFNEDVFKSWTEIKQR